jgi:hypothetical protein
MQDSKQYRQYAADCRRLAATMGSKDKEILLTMAEAWEARAQEAERKESGNRER